MLLGSNITHYEASDTLFKYDVTIGVNRTLFSGKVTLFGVNVTLISANLTLFWTIVTISGPM